MRLRFRLGQFSVICVECGNNRSSRMLHFNLTFAILMVFLTFGFDYCFLFISFPPENKEVINLIAGVLNSTCLVAVVNFFFGSSQGSKAKTEQIDKLIDNDKP